MHKDVTMIQAQAKEHAQSQKGNVLVEFALILPVFLAILLGLVFFSLALYNKTVITMATREGARAGAVYVENQTDDDIRSRADNATSQFCQNKLISFGSGTTPTITPTISGDNISVSANVNFTGLSFFPGVVISSETSMRIERP